MARIVDDLGYRITMLHGGKSQDQREESIKVGAAVRLRLIAEFPPVAPVNGCWELDLTSWRARTSARSALRWAFVLVKQRWAWCGSELAVAGCCFNLMASQHLAPARPVMPRGFTAAPP